MKVCRVTGWKDAAVCGSWCGGNEPEEQTGVDECERGVLWSGEEDLR